MNDEVIKIQLTNGYMPKRATNGAAGYDLYVAEDFLLKPGRQVVPLGFRIELQQGRCAHIEPRSGYSSKGLEAHRIKIIPNDGILPYLGYDFEVTRIDADVLLGLVDSDYRGIVGAIVKNNTKENWIITAGTRIAQMTISRVETPVLMLTTEDLSATDRNDGGFGHTNERKPSL